MLHMVSSADTFYETYISVPPIANDVVAQELTVLTRCSCLSAATVQQI